MNQRAVTRKMRKHGRKEREIRVKCRSPEDRCSLPPVLSSINWGSLGHSEMWEDSEEGSLGSSLLLLGVEDLDTKFFTVLY